MKTSDFDYNLPKSYIAQHPIVPRDHSRIMIVNRQNRTIRHDYFYHLPQYLTKNDVLVFNETKVIPARLFGKKETGGKVEVILIKKRDQNLWECLTKPGIKNNQKIIFSNKISARAAKIDKDGHRYLEFSGHPSLDNEIFKLGVLPIPPYITKPLDSNKQYQTVYAKNTGSIAAPTAGFHFTKRLLDKLRQQGIHDEYLTLHVGLGTFLPVKSLRIENHKMHSETFNIDENTFNRLIEYKQQQKNIVAVGTTTTRTLESVFGNNEEISKDPTISGETNLFIYPGYRFRFVDKIITNFHLPQSTLLMLVSAFADRELIMEAYQEAIRKKYRFYSFGDAMLIL